MSKVMYIDVETSGLNTSNNALLQLAGIIEIDGKERESFNFLIRPHKSALINDRALEVNGMTREEIKEYPPYKKQYNNFIAILSGYIDKYDKTDKFYFVGYNARFDMDFLREFFNRNNNQYFGSWFFFPPIDVMNIAAVHMMISDERCKDFKLITIAEHYGISLENKKMHDAMTDIRVTQKLFKVLKRL